MVQMRTRKFAFEIIWPLHSVINMIWVTLLLCEILLEAFGLYDSGVGIIAIKNKFDVKTITGIVLHYNYIINMVDSGLKVTVAIWLLILGPKNYKNTAD